MDSKNLIGISMGCFYYWSQQKDLLSDQIGFISIISKYVNRVELHFSPDDIYNISNKQIIAYKDALGDMRRSIHLPSISEYFKKEDFASKIEYLFSELGIEYGVLHVDEYAKIKRLKLDFNPSYKIGLENSDIRKFSFQHLGDLELFKSFPIILDIDHIEEMKSGSLDEELKDLKNDILAIHFSSPQSKYFEKYKDIETTHYPYTRSGLTPPKSIPQGVPVIVEGVIPPNEIDLLKEEVTLIEKSYFS